MTKLLGITVTGGLSSENRVFARLLAERADRYGAQVVVHDETGARDGVAAQFAELAETPTVPLDTGWRPNPWAYRGNRLGRPWCCDTGTVSSAPSPPPTNTGPTRSTPPSSTTTVGPRQGRHVTRPAAIVHLHYTVGPWLRRVVLNQLRTTDRVVAVSDFVPSTGDHPRRTRTPDHHHPQHDPGVRPARQRNDSAAPPRARAGGGSIRLRFGRVPRPGQGPPRCHHRVRAIARERDNVALMLVGTGRIEKKVHARAAIPRLPIASSRPANDPTCRSCSRYSTRSCTPPRRIRARWRCSRRWRPPCRSPPTTTADCPS